MKLDIQTLQEKAVDAAVKGSWDEAIKINKKIIKAAKSDPDAHLRLGFALLSKGKLTKARKAYLKALKLQPANPIATNNLEKIRILEKKGEKVKTGKVKSHYFDPNLFINIIGKTKVVSLINIGQASVLAKLKIGQPVIIKIKRRKVEVRTENNDYIGALPDDISKRLMLFLNAASTYRTYIKEASKNNVDIFIHEEKKGKKVVHYTSFPKNIQDDIKLMTGEEEEKEDEDEEEESQDEEEEAPVDIEKIAEEVAEAEYIQTPEALEDEDEEE